MSQLPNGPICPTCHQAWPQDPPPPVVPAQPKGFRDLYPYPGPFPGSVWGTLADNVKSMGELRGRPLREVMERLGEPTLVQHVEDGVRHLEWSRVGNLASFKIVLAFDDTNVCGGVVERVQDPPDGDFYQSLMAKRAEHRPRPGVNWNVGVLFPVDLDF